MSAWLEKKAGGPSKQCNSLIEHLDRSLHHGGYNHCDAKSL